MAQKNASDLKFERKISQVVRIRQDINNINNLALEINNPR